MAATSNAYERFTAAQVGFQVDQVIEDVARLSRSMDGMPTASQMSAGGVGSVQVVAIDGFEGNLGVAADRLRALLLGVQLILDQHADGLKAAAAMLAEAEAAAGDVLGAEGAAVEAAITTVTDRAANDAETIRVQEDLNRRNSEEDH